MLLEYFGVLAVNWAADRISLTHLGVHNEFLWDEQESMLRRYISLGSEAHQLAVSTIHNWVLDRGILGAMLLQPLVKSHVLFFLL